MSSENTVRTFEFTAAGAGPWVPASNSLLVQTDVGVSVEAVTLIGQSPEVLGIVSANDFDRYDTAHAFVRLVADGSGSAAISASIPTPAGAGGGGGSGTSDTTEATQLLVKAAVQNLDADVGAPADTAATSDTGAFSLIALVKRALQNWTTLLARVPALVSGRMPVDGSGVTQPVSAATLPLPAGAATESTLAAASAKLPALVSGRMPVDPTGAVQTGTGTVTATTQRVTLATDGPGVANLSSIDGKTPALVNSRTPVDTDRVVKQLIDAPSATVTYVCEANTVGAATSAAAWRIKRITVSGTTTTIQWGGTGAFDQIADNRATTVVYA